MSSGPERARLRSYLAGNKHAATERAGENWAASGRLLADTARVLRKGAEKVRDGDGNGEGLSGVTAQAVLDAFQASAASMQEKAAKLTTAGEALRQTADVIRRAEEAEARMADLQQPPPYSPPTYSPGYQPTPAEIQSEGAKRSSANQQMSSYTAARAQQEAAAIEWSQKMDAAFLSAIPPMQEIHGEPDPTEPPPVPGPGGQAGPSGSRTPAPSGPATPGPSGPSTPGTTTTPTDPTPNPTSNPTPTPAPTPTSTSDPSPNPSPGPGPGPSAGPTTTVIGSSQTGLTLQPGGTQVPAPVPGGGGASGAATTAGAFGAAGGAGAMSAGAIRPGATPGSPARGAGPVRAIGSTGKAGSPGALSRTTGSPGSPAARGAAARGATTGSTAGRSAGGGSIAGRGAAGSSAGARGSAGGRGGASGASGTKGGAGGSTGARNAGSGAGAGRGVRKGEREQTTDRDSLVYDQDWLGDDDIAPGVLD